MYELALVGLALPAFDPAFADGPALTAAVKIPGLLVRHRPDAAAGVGGEAVHRRRARRALGRARVLAEPGDDYQRRGARLPRSADDAAGIGALVLLHVGAAESAGLALALALLTKPQAHPPGAGLRARGLAHRRCARAGCAPRRAASSARDRAAAALRDDRRAAEHVAGVRIVLRAARHPVRQRGQRVVDRELRAARLLPDPAARLPARVLRRGPADHGGQHVPGARASRTRGRSPAPRCWRRRLGAVAPAPLAAIWPSTRWPRRSSSTPSSCSASACTSIT